MDEKDFEGTLVLEQLAAIGRVDDFFEAIDSDDIERATALMKRAKCGCEHHRRRDQEDGGQRRGALTLIVGR